MNILRRISWLALGLCLAFQTLAQDRYAVYFTDKAGVTFDPLTYFDAKALERRIKHGLPLNDPSDWPLNPDYVQAVVSAADSLKMTSRWLNLAVVYAQPEQLAAIEALSFVRKIEPLGYSEVLFAGRTDDQELSDRYMHDLALRQTAVMGIRDFHDNGITGKGICVAVFDAGFPGVDTHPAFEHIRKREGIKGTYDFIKNREFVYNYGAHGTNVLSNIAGMWDTIPLGLAIEAEFLLARTEMMIREPLAEEENWLAAAEWADKEGADIINSSLGYGQKRYFPRDMDGQTALVTRAANMAASKGILVVNAAGNEGDKGWKVIGAPADADSILSIGGVDPRTGFHIFFSSYGPTADKRLKPNVSAFGQTTVAKPEDMGTNYGTSFSSPLVAGFAACAMQAKSKMTSQQLKREIEQSGNLYPYYDYAHGYGIPQAAYFTESEQTESPVTFDLEKSPIGFTVVVRDSFFTPTDTSERFWSQVSLAYEDPLDEDYVYYHLENEAGFLGQYYVVRVTTQRALQLIHEELKGYRRLRIHYRGYTLTKEL